MTVKVRLIGEADEVAAVALALRGAVPVLSQSPQKREFDGEPEKVSVYLRVRPDARDGAL